MHDRNLISQLQREGFSHTYVWEDGPNTRYPDHTHRMETVHVILSGELLPSTNTMCSADALPKLWLKRDAFTLARIPFSCAARHDPKPAFSPARKHIQNQHCASAGNKRLYPPLKSTLTKKQEGEYLTSD